MAILFRLACKFLPMSSSPRASMANTALIKAKRSMIDGNNYSKTRTLLSHIDFSFFNPAALRAKFAGAKSLHDHGLTF